MSKWQKLLRKASTAPAGLRFEELCWLLEHAGFIRKRSSGSHVFFKHPDGDLGSQAGITVQEGPGGKAKTYQVRQVVSRVIEFDLGPNAGEQTTDDDNEDETADKSRNREAPNDH